MKENDFKRWVKANWLGWSETYEPRKGSGVGIADMQFLVNGQLLPVELKVGRINYDMLYIDEVRPDQIGWHFRLNKAGGKSIFLIAVGFRKPERILAYSAPFIREWHFGLVMAPENEINPDKNKFHNSMHKFCTNLLSSKK